MSEMAPGYVTHEECDHIFFVGFLGAGKTTLAKSLGGLFGRRYVDVDRLVERRLGKGIGDIFSSFGEGAFRDAETKELQALKRCRSLLVSCGSGIVERHNNIELMHEMGVIVFLDGSLEDSLRRIVRTDRRPDLGDADQAARVYQHRRPLYEQACDYRISIANRSFDDVTTAASELLLNEGLL